MKVSQKVLAIIIVFVMFGGIALSATLNLWITESTKIPDKFEKGAAVGEYNPSDIKGSYTFKDVSELFKIPLEDLSIAFNLPKDVNAAEFKNKELETIYKDMEFEIGNGSVKLFVAMYKGLPYELSGDTYLLDSAAKIIKEKGKPTPEQIKYLDAHTVKINK